MSLAKRNVTFVTSLENPSVLGQFKRHCPLKLFQLPVNLGSIQEPDLYTVLNKGAMLTVNVPGHTVCVCV